MGNALKIKQCILDIGKATITFNEATKDYLFNGKNPRELPDGYYSTLYHNFIEYLNLQLSENCTEELLKKYIGYAESARNKLSSLLDQHRVSFVFSKSKNKLSNSAEYTHADINARLNTQISLLNNIIKKLLPEVEFADYKTSQDYRNEVLPQRIENIDHIPFPNYNKHLVKMKY